MALRQIFLSYSKSYYLNKLLFSSIACNRFFLPSFRTIQNRFYSIDSKRSQSSSNMITNHSEKKILQDGVNNIKQEPNMKIQNSGNSDTKNPIKTSKTDTNLKQQIQSYIDMLNENKIGFSEIQTLFNSLRTSVDSYIDNTNNPLDMAFEISCTDALRFFERCLDRGKKSALSYIGDIHLSIFHKLYNIYANYDKYAASNVNSPIKYDKSLLERELKNEYDSIVKNYTASIDNKIMSVCNNYSLLYLFDYKLPFARFDIKHGISLLEKGHLNGDSFSSFTLFYLYHHNILIDEKLKKESMERNSAIISNNPNGLNELGKRLLYGVNTSSDDILKGVEYLKQAASFGHGDSFYQLGSIYLYGLTAIINHQIDVIERDINLGISYLKEGVRVKNNNSLALLGNIYFFGFGDIKPDNEEAYSYHYTAAIQGHPYSQSRFWYEQAALREFTPAKTILGEFLLQSKEVDKGVQLISEAADKSDSRALTRLAQMNIKGEFSFPKDIAKGMKYLEKAASFNYPPALTMLGSIYHSGEGVKKDSSKAVEYYNKAIELNDPVALYSSSLLHFEMNKIKEAVDYLIRSTNLHYPPALFYYGILVENGFSDSTDVNIKKDKEKAFSLYAEAAELGFADAQYKVGQCYVKGIGVEKNIEEGKKWLKKCNNDNARSLIASLDKKN